MELVKEDDIDEHEKYFINTLSNPCSYEKFPKSIGLSNIVTHKNFERVVVDAYVYHKYCKSDWHEYWDRHTKVGVGGKTTSPI